MEIRITFFTSLIVGCFAALGCGSSSPSDGNQTGTASGTWHVRKPDSPTHLYAVAWTGTQAVAVGDNNLETSPDGVTWTHQLAATGPLRGLTWTGSTTGAGGGQLVGVGLAGNSTFPATILTSPDGLVWTHQVSGTVNDLHAVTWTGSQLVAVGQNVILTSPDGTTWTTRNAGGFALLHSVVWTGSQLVVVGGDDAHGVILTSPDGITWTPRTSGTTSSLRSVTWTGSQLVAVGNGEDAPSTVVVLTSPDGITWTPRTTPSSGTSTDSLSSVIWTGSELVAVGVGPTSGSIMSSPDGATWTLQTTDTRTGELVGLTWTGRRLVAVGLGDSIVYSP